MEPVSLILVDDHKIVRDGIKAMLAGHTRFAVVGEASHAQQCYDLLMQVTPAVVVLDIKMPGENGLEVAEKLRKDFPRLRILMLTAEADEGALRQCFRLKVDGIISKESGRDVYLDALDQVAAGKTYYDSKLLGLINPSGFSNEPELTEREIEVLRGFSQGLSYKEIGSKLNISPRTVETHKQHIQEKLNLHSTAELIKYAIRQGIIRID
jgi:DNA-binding NarL/FixJ family response regulator